MAFMTPIYTNEDFVTMSMNDGWESFSVPADVADLQTDCTIEETHKGKWFVRLSASGYMDATEWDGPFETIEQAKQHVIDQWEVDPDTGDELDD